MRAYVLEGVHSSNGVSDTNKEAVGARRVTQTMLAFILGNDFRDSNVGWSTTFWSRPKYIDNIK